MNEIKSFSFYREYYDLITFLKKEEQKDLLLKIIMFVFEDEEVTELSENQLKIWNNIGKPINAYKTNAVNGLKGGRPKTQTKTQKETETITQNITQKESTSNDVIVNVNVDVYVYKNIIDYLNLKTNKNYRYTTKKTQDLIKARLNEGFTLEDFKTVIDKKIQDEYFIENDYLRPETLFSNKFESYLNQNVKKVKTAEDKSNNLKELMKYR